MRLEGIQIGDIVEVDRLGRRFHGLVTGNANGGLSVQPLDRRISYRTCRTHDVVAYWAKRGRPRQTNEPLELSPLQLEPARPYAAGIQSAALGPSEPASPAQCRRGPIPTSARSLRHSVSSATSGRSPARVVKLGAHRLLLLDRTQQRGVERPDGRSAPSGGHAARMRPLTDRADGGARA